MAEIFGHENSSDGSIWLAIQFIYFYIFEVTKYGNICQL